jgi:hypothetical protein
MKKQNILFWILTGIMAAYMLMSSIPDVMQVASARAFFIHLGYPPYLLPFMGVAKILGVAAVLTPGTQRLKEWAYAGLVFDVLGAFYSHISVGDSIASWIFPVIGLLLVGGSYACYRKKTDQLAAPASSMKSETRALSMSQTPVTPFCDVQ